MLDKYNLDAELKKAIVEVVNIKMIPHPVKIKAEINLTCFTIGGIDDIKAALAEGMKASTSDIPVKINMISSPKYEVYTETVKKVEGLAVVNDVIKIIEAEIKKRNGSFGISQKAEIMGENAIKDLEEQMKEMKKQQEEEVDDEDEEDYEEGIKANVEGIDTVEDGSDN